MNPLHPLSGDVVMATGNAGKVAELNRLFGDRAFRLRPQSEFSVIEAEETGLCFVENAILKARAAAQQTGLPALADDSGLEVDALNGAPGVHSARYAGSSGGNASSTANNAKLLETMAGIPDGQRQARFHCVLVLLLHASDPMPLIAHGTWEGEILRAPRGVGGFGYDPLFFLPEYGLSVAELDPTLKNTVSHRGLAAQQLLARLSGA